MTSAITKAFKNAEENGMSAFVPFMTAGFPDPSTFIEIVQSLDQAGADVIELGLPFSDPLADGPVIQKSSHMALQNGTTPQGVLDLAAQLKPRIKSPLVVMTYWNPVLRLGPEYFASRAADSGVSGVIVPDLPPEEAGPWLEAAEANGLDTIFLAAPTTPFERSRKIARLTKGFLYYVSLTGVTGSDFVVTDELIETITALRRMAGVPVAAGFGVSGPNEAGPLAAAADGVIVGSSLIREVLTHDQPAEQVAAVTKLALSIKEALKR